MVFSQLQLAYLYYFEHSLEPYSLTELLNCSLCESLIKSFEAPKSGKSTKTPTATKIVGKHQR